MQHVHVAADVRAIVYAAVGREDTEDVVQHELLGVELRCVSRAVELSQIASVLHGGIKGQGSDHLCGERKA